MKQLILFVLILGSAREALAGCTDSVTNVQVKEQQEISAAVPAHLRGAVIFIRLADGSESYVSAERFKVVPRKQQFVITKVQQDTLRTCSKEQRNRVSVLAGQGPKGGLNRTQHGGAVAVESQYGFTAGVQYQRDIGVSVFGLPVSIGVQAQDNETGLGLVGVEF